MNLKKMSMKVQACQSLTSLVLRPASLCGGLSNIEITSEKFEEKTLTYEEFIEQIKNQKSTVTDPNLVIRMHDKYLKRERNLGLDG